MTAAVPAKGGKQPLHGLPSPQEIVSVRLPEHSNETWVEALKGDRPDSDSMALELSAYLRRVLASTLRRRGPSDDELDELTQEAFSQLLSYLHTFRGDSRFGTWAAAVATRVAFTELRRRAAHAERHASFTNAQGDALAERASAEPEPDDTMTRRFVLEALDHAVATDLTDKQRVASLALLRGVPTIEIAERTGSNQNAVYKLVHDARLRLRESLESRGITVDVVAEMASEGAGQR